MKVNKPVRKLFQFNLWPRADRDNPQGELFMLDSTGYPNVLIDGSSIYNTKLNSIVFHSFDIYKLSHLIEKDILKNPTTYNFIIDIKYVKIK